MVVIGHSSPLMLPSTSSREIPERVSPSCCSIEQPLSSKLGVRQVISGLAASILLISRPNLAVAVDLPHRNNFCQLASATLPIDKEGDGMMMMKKAMTVNNFDPVRYSGRWFEVASLKRGFAGQGQEDCHCTQGIYTFDANAPAIQVDTFCVHGGPSGYITGIRGRVRCLLEEDMANDETDLEKQGMVKDKCFLRFPTLPFIPKLPYDVFATDYDNFALVSGARDKSFIQIYSRTPNPGEAFIEKYKAYLVDFGYDASKIKNTPQDCEVMSNSQLTAMMSAPGMQKTLINQFPDLELTSSIQLNPFTSVFDTFKKLVALYFKK